MEMPSSPSSDGSFQSFHEDYVKSCSYSSHTNGAIVIIGSLVPDVSSQLWSHSYIQSYPSSNTLKTTKKIFRVSKLQNRYIVKFSV